METRFPLYLLLGLLCFATGTYAQGNVGFRISPSDDHCEVFYVSAPDAIPIFRDDMPWEVGLAYTVIDTLCKTYTAEEIEDRLPYLSDDSLQIAWNIFQRATEYDSFLPQYILSYMDFHIPEGYKASWREVLGLFIQEYYSRYILSGEDEYQGPNLASLSELCSRVEGIYRIQVIGGSARADSGYGGMPYSVRPCITSTHCSDGEVLSIYKGYRYYSACQSSDYELTEENGCLRITWSSFSCDTSAIDTWLSRLDIGKEYLVFVSYYQPSWEIDPTPFIVSSVKRFEIQNGILLDPTHYFSDEDEISFNEVDMMIVDTMNALTGR